MRDSIARIVRTLAQGIGAAGLIALYQAFATTPLTPMQVGAAEVVLTSLVAAVMIATENQVGVGLLRDPKATPVRLDKPNDPLPPAP